MIRDGDRVLVQEKILGGGSSGIIFPGGHVEKGEPVVDSVIREIYEETGLTVRSPKLCGVKDWMNEDGSRYIVFLFTAEEFSGELRSSDEGRVFWTDIGNVLELPVIWHMDSMMRIFDTGEFSELFLDDKNDWEPVLK